jgi:hypothetical protein
MNLNKLSLSAIIIIVALILGGFYYASEKNKQKSIKSQQQIKMEQEKQKQATKEQFDKEPTRVRLGACLAESEQTYMTQWISECKLRDLMPQGCEWIREMTFIEYLIQKKIPRENREKVNEAAKDYDKARAGCTCVLPADIAKSLEDNQKNHKDVCFKKYSQG